MKRQSAQKELWEVAHEWLTQLNSGINKKFCKEEITSHPDYPSLISLIDFLDSGHFEYRAVRMNISHLKNLELPSLIHINSPGEEYMSILNIGETDFESLKFWSGIIVVPGENAKWKSEQHDTFVKAETKKTVSNSVLAILGLLVWFISARYFQNVSIILFALLSLMGIVISVALVNLELGIRSDLVNQVCGTFGKFGCEHILKSGLSKGLLGLTLSDLSLLFFSSQYIYFTLSAFLNLPIGGILILSIPIVLVAFASLYTQAIILKDWCALCLGIVIILFSQCFIVLLDIRELIAQTPKDIFISHIIWFGVVFSFLGIAFYPIKNLLKNNERNKAQIKELKKWKLDGSLFLKQWKEEEEVYIDPKNYSTILGNQIAPVQITVACNPYCNPCAKTHKLLDLLLKEFPDKVGLQLVFLCNNEAKNDPRTLAVKAILQKSRVTHDNLELQKLINEWFEWMDLNKWKTRWQPDESIDVEEEMKKHFQWLNIAQVQFTPTLFLNKRRIPSRYSIDDTKALMPQLIHLFE